MNIKELLNRTDRFAANAGCQITEVDEQHAVAVMTVTAEHLNGGNGTVRFQFHSHHHAFRS